MPKPMALINQKPFLKYLLDWLSYYGVSKVIFAVGYKYDIIKDSFGEEYKGIEVYYSIEIEPLGTVDCCIDNQPIQVGYYDENDCFESRTGMFDREEMYFD